MPIWSVEKKATAFILNLKIIQYYEIYGKNVTEIKGLQFFSFIYSWTLCGFGCWRCNVPLAQIQFG